MKLKFIVPLFSILLTQMSVQAQNGPANNGYGPGRGPALEVEVQSLPSNNEDSYYDNSGRPYIDNVRNPNQVRVQYQDNQSYQGNGNTAPNRGYNPGGPNIPANQRNDNGPNRPVGQIQQTLSIIKPDAVGTNHIGDVISRLERAGLRVAAIKMTVLTKDQAGQFYAEHKGKPFYPELVDFMTSGPVVVMVLEGPDAIAKNRQIMGATNPQKAEPGTIRADYAESMSRNAVHGSDSPDAAKKEINFFFKGNDIYKR